MTGTLEFSDFLNSFLTSNSFSKRHLILKYFLSLLFLLSSFGSLAQQAQLTALMRQQQVPGMQVVYTRNGHVTTYHLGLRQNGTTQLVQDNTTFQAASLGKLVLAYTALRLHDRGLIDLNKPLLGYCPYPRLAAQPAAATITGRMVLTHTTGLPNWAKNPLSPAWATSTLALRYPPDSCWNYSGEGFAWLQKTLEHITGKSFETLAQEEAFGPLRMARSSFVWRATFDTNAAAGHDKAGKPTEIRRFATANAGFSLLTTATDYNRFLQALLTGRGLLPATHKLLLTPATAANRCRTPASPTDPYIAWAYGVGLATTSCGPAQWHWGNNGDFKGFFMTFPKRKESLLFLTNSANGLQLTDDILQLFFGPGEYRAMQWLAEDQ